MSIWTAKPKVERLRLSAKSRISFDMFAVIDSKPVERRGRPKGSKKAPTAREIEMRERYTAGKETLEEIGVRFGVTRERVRQIMQGLGVTYMDSGLSRVVQARRAEQATAKASKEAAYHASFNEFFGCTIAEIRAICGPSARTFHRKGAKGERQTSFVQLKRNAQRCGLEFTLTFPQWWAVWEASRRFKDRGLTVGHYCVARIDTDKGYIPGNVIIKESGARSRDGFIKHPWAERQVKAAANREARAHA